MNLFPRIKEVLEAKPDEAQLDKFLSDVRESLATSNKQFISLPLLAIATLVTYHLVVYKGGTITALSYVKVSNTTLFHRVFLVVPAALLAAASCIGYLRRCQREVYDFLAIGRCRILGKTGLNELRLPADYILGQNLLYIQGGVVGRILSTIMGSLAMTIFALAPAYYVVRSAYENIVVFGASDPLAILASCIAITLSVVSLLVIGLGMCITVKEM
jgi:hypothetical protein